MNQKERSVIIVVLFVIALVVGADLVTDSKEGVKLWHVVIEGGAGIAALSGVFYLLLNTSKLRSELSLSQENLAKSQMESAAWRQEAKKYLVGLSASIDQQLTKWNLSAAEKEVAFLLLKGLSIKEIADVRKTTEKTAKAQSIAVYSKSGLSGRSELAAFFLEDLLVPQEPISE